MAPKRRRLLILGGTTEARELAGLATAELGDRLDVVTSLAGRTERPGEVAGTVRRGGFGGVEGLTAYLRDQRIDYLIDATHPFAARISTHAAEAAAALAIPNLAVGRPPWTAAAGDRWIEVASASAAATRLPGLGRRVWLTVGAADIAAFSNLVDTWFLVRRIDAPDSELPLQDYLVILGRGPFALADERRLIIDHRIEVLVCRSSGGAATEAKLVAAREIGLPVVMIRRPDKPFVSSVQTPAAAVGWLAACLNA